MSCLNCFAQKEVNVQSIDSWLDLPNNQLGKLHKSHLDKISSYSKEIQREVDSIDAKILELESLREANNMSSIDLADAVKVLEELPELKNKINKFLSKMEYLLENRSLRPIFNRLNIKSTLDIIKDEVVQSVIKVTGTECLRGAYENLGWDTGDLFEGFSERLDKMLFSSSISEDDVKNAKKLLNIDGSYDLKSLERAYRKMALKHHPDKNNGSKESTVLFQKIVEAYELLKKML